MADTDIAALADSGPILTTDLLVLERATGVGYKVAASRLLVTDANGNSGVFAINAGIAFAVGAIGASKNIGVAMNNCYARLREYDYINDLAVVTNVSHTGAIDDTSRSSWKLRLGSGSDAFTIARAAAGSATFADLAKVDAAGNLRGGGDNVQALGAASYRWSVVYAGTGAINTSDQREKTEIAAIPDDWLDAWGDVAWSRFKFAAVVADKGESARWHVGLVAQAVRDAFAARGLDAAAIGLLCYDQWPAEPAVDEQRDEAGVIIVAARAARPAGDRWGLRYDECFAIEAAYQRRRLDRIEAKLAA